MSKEAGSFLIKHYNITYPVENKKNNLKGAWNQALSAGVPPLKYGWGKYMG
jgi:hypothetical protein